MVSYIDTLKKQSQNNYSFNWANDESFWSQNKATSPGMRTLKNPCNNGNRDAESVFVVSWNLLLTRALFCRFAIFIAYWHLLIISLKCYLFSRGLFFEVAADELRNSSSKHIFVRFSCCLPAHVPLQKGDH